jgi:hypothetical protein
VPSKAPSHLAFSQNLESGDRVWAPWGAAGYFAGTVDQIREKKVHIHFDDGDRGWVPLEQVFPLEITVGMRLVGRWRMGPRFYPGTVTEVRGDRIHVQYDDGDREWTTAAALAVPFQPVDPAAAQSARNSPRRNRALGWLLLVVIGACAVFLRIGCR